MIAQTVGKTLESMATTIGFKDAKKGKIIIIGAIGFLAAGAIFLGVRTIVKRKKAEKYGVSEMEGELGDIGVSKNNLTITNGDAILLSQNIFSAMDRYGTDEKAIYNAFEKIKTKDDLLLVIQKFGTKLYQGVGLATTWVDKKLMSTPKNMNGWLRAEMTTRELRPVKEVYDRVGVTL